MEKTLKFLDAKDKVILYIGAFGSLASLTGFTLRDIFPKFVFNFSFLLLTISLFIMGVYLIKYIDYLYDKNDLLLKKIEEISTSKDIEITCKNNCQKSITENLDEKTTDFLIKLNTIDDYLSNIKTKLESDSQSFGLYNLTDLSLIILVSLSSTTNEYTLSVNGTGSYYINFEGRHIPAEGITNMFIVMDKVSGPKSAKKVFRITSFPGLCIGIFSYTNTVSKIEKSKFDVEIKKDDILIETTQFNL